MHDEALEGPHFCWVVEEPYSKHGFVPGRRNHRPVLLRSRHLPYSRAPLVLMRRVAIWVPTGWSRCRELLCCEPSVHASSWSGVVDQSCGLHGATNETPSSGGQINRMAARAIPTTSPRATTRPPVGGACVGRPAVASRAAHGRPGGRAAPRSTGWHSEGPEDGFKIVPGPSPGRLRAVWAVVGPSQTAQQRETTLTDGRRFPLVSAVSGPVIRQPAWSPRRSCRSLRSGGRGGRGCLLRGRDQGGRG